MKKRIILLASTFALLACSEDIYQEIDQHNEEADMRTPSSFESSDPGYINPGGIPYINPGSGYQSPWDIWFRNQPFTPVYQFSNRGGVGHTSPLRLEIIPWAGLAYYDDNDDGDYTDLYLALQTGGSGIVANMNNGNYPNLFFNNQEVGNLVPADPITLDGTTIDESELIIASDPSLTLDEHLLANPANKLTPFNNNDKVFTFSSLTPQEQDLLMKYGKVFYYEVHIYENATGAPLGTYYVQYRNESLENGYANYIPIPGYTANDIPNNNVLSNDVYYYKNLDPNAQNETQWGTMANPLYPTSPNPPGTINPGFTCNSREVVIESIHPERDTFNYTQPWEIYVTMPIGSHLWRTSGPLLVVQPQ